MNSSNLCKGEIGAKASATPFPTKVPNDACSHHLFGSRHGLYRPALRFSRKRSFGKPKVVFFGFEMINTSPEATTDAENHRLSLIADALTKTLANSGRYEIVPLSDALKQKIEGSSKISGCNGCQINWARRPAPISPPGERCRKSAI